MVDVDERTLQAARTGNRAALATLLRELADPWFRFSLSLLGDADRAHEAAQETGLRFMKALPAFRGDSQLQTWSLGIALNVVREMRRKSRAIPEDGKAYLALGAAARRAGAVESPEAAADLAGQRQRLHAVPTDPPERQREAVGLRVF